jgi:hypothetical protein
VIGVEVLAGTAVGYLIRKAQRVAHRADGHVDDALDVGTDRVCGLVEGALGLDPVLTQLNEQSQAGTASDRTIRRAEDAIAEKAEADVGFRQQLELLLTKLERVPGGIAVSAPGGFAAGRDVNIRSSGPGVAAGTIGSVHINMPDAPSRAGRADARLVGLWECVAGAGGVTGAVAGPWDLSGSHFFRFGEDGHGRADYVNWRAAFRLGGRSGAACEINADGTRNLAYSANDGSYRDVPDPFIGNIRCKLNGKRWKEMEAAWLSLPPTNCNYMIADDRLALYTDSWRRDYRRYRPS